MKKKYIKLKMVTKFTKCRKKVREKWDNKINIISSVHTHTFILYIWNMKDRLKRIKAKFLKRLKLIWDQIIDMGHKQRKHNICIIVVKTEHIFSYTPVMRAKHSNT